MVLIAEAAGQAVQMMLVLALAPLLAGLVRKAKARLQRRRGPPLLQPYRDLRRLIGKEVVLADNASWLFRVAPYMVFSATWVAAALVPTFATGLLFSWSGDLIAIIALLGSARFLQALAGLDIGTSFGGIGASREVMIASLAEPATIMIEREAGGVPDRQQRGRAHPALGDQPGEGVEMDLLLRLHVAQQALPARAAQHGELALVDALGAVFAGMVDADRARHRLARRRVAGQAPLAGERAGRRGVGRRRAHATRDRRVARNSARAPRPSA